MSARHSQREEVTYRRRYVGTVEYHRSRYGHGYASMAVYRFECVGERSGPDYVLVHGIGVSAKAYGPTAVELVEHSDVLLVDLPGYGRSPRPDIDMTIADHAKVLSDFLADRNLDHPLVVGHSMGTQVVAELAADYPDQIDHIALIAPVIVPEARSLPGAARLLLRNGRLEPLSVTAMAVQDYLFGAGIPYMMQQTKHLLGARIEELAEQITAKTLVICGDTDPIVPLEWGQYLAASLRHGWYETVPGPHATMFAAPKLIADLLYEHGLR
ncbi:MAG: alpha/beta fold hydrolase [Micropruina sp.]|uniref:alpha/beta fold hydrolase n=1 Tax=Micropruina sp. TaxID=2737536 RepID=UPI0039E42A2B